MQRPDQPARNMWRRQSDESHQPAKGDRRCHHDRTRQHRHRHEARDVETEGRRHRFAQPQHVEPLRQQQGQTEAGQRNGHQQGDPRPGRCLHATQHPAHHDLQAHRLVGQREHQEGTQRAQDRRHRHAGQQQPGRIDRAGDAGNADHQHRGAPGTGEGEQRQQQRLRHSEWHQQGHRGTESGAAGRAQQIGFGQRIAEHALIDRAAKSKQRADQRRGHHARQPPLQEQAAAHRRIAVERAPQIERRGPILSGAGCDRDGDRQNEREADPDSHCVAIGWKSAARCSIPSMVRGPGISSSVRLTA